MNFRRQAYIEEENFLIPNLSERWFYRIKTITIKERNVEVALEAQIKVLKCKKMKFNRNNTGVIKYTRILFVDLYSDNNYSDYKKYTLLIQIIGIYLPLSYST